MNREDCLDNERLAAQGLKARIAQVRAQREEEERRAAAVKILARIEQVILRIEDPRIERNGRDLDDWLAQILQVLVMDRDIAGKEIDILIDRVNQLLRAQEALP